MVARSFSGNMEHLAEMMAQALLHKGFSFIDVLQPCVTFNNTYERYNESVEVLDQIPESYDEAVALARRKDKLPIGIFYQAKKPAHHQALYGDWNPVLKRLSRKERLKKVASLLSPR